MFFKAVYQDGFMLLALHLLLFHKIWVSKNRPLSKGMFFVLVMIHTN